MYIKKKSNLTLDLFEIKKKFYSVFLFKNILE